MTRICFYRQVRTYCDRGCVHRLPTWFEHKSGASVDDLLRMQCRHVRARAVDELYRSVLDFRPL